MALIRSSSRGTTLWNRCRNRSSSNRRATCRLNVMMDVSGFLISWARPAASVPSAARRSERRSCSSSWRTGVRSRRIATTPSACPSAPRRGVVATSTGIGGPSPRGSTSKTCGTPTRVRSVSRSRSRSSGTWWNTSVAGRPVSTARRAPGEGLRGGVHGDHAAVEVERHEPVHEGPEDVVGVALQVGQLREALVQRRVGDLEVRPLLPELRGHLVERERQPAELVGAAGVDALVQLPARDRRDAVGELADRAGDAPGDDRRRQAAQHEGDHRQRGQLPPGAGDLGVHPLARERDPHGAPAAALDQDRHRDVVERLPVRPGRLLEHGRAREGPEGHRVRRRRPHRPGRPAVRHDLAEPVEDHRVDHVGLAVEAHDVLLERREVVEEERARRHAGQPLRHRRPAAVDLLDDGRPLPVLDDGRHGGHEHGDDQRWCR